MEGEKRYRTRLLAIRHVLSPVRETVIIPVVSRSGLGDGDEIIVPAGSYVEVVSIGAANRWARVVVRSTPP